VEIEEEPALQVPNLSLQPWPQWAEVEPQMLLDEQQLPKVEPLQVLPFLAQLPSVEIVEAPALQVPNLSLQPWPQ
jgi:hypothetical protein